MPSSTDNEQHYSRFRGVFRSGKRWKSQLQVVPLVHSRLSQLFLLLLCSLHEKLRQVSYYVGTFDTEEEAARAFDEYARKQGVGSDFPFNFDGNKESVHIKSRLDFIEKKKSKSSVSGLKRDHSSTSDLLISMSEVMELTFKFVFEFNYIDT